jgi:hypothetical protein
MVHLLGGVGTASACADDGVSAHRPIERASVLAGNDEFAIIAHFALRNNVAARGRQWIARQKS